MIKLGLIGSHISHSLSPKLYSDLIKSQHTYSLLDYTDKSQLPSLSDLSDFYGLNITAPWKKTYLGQLVSFDTSWEAVNCLRNFKGEWKGINTDALALKELIPDVKSKYCVSLWIILGDGAMANVTKKILNDLGLSFVQHSRSMGDDFDRFSFFSKYSIEKDVCVINSCGREAVIKGSLSSDWIFWDYNYNHHQHALTLPSKVRRYLDGKSLLNLQANYAVKFWDLA